MNTYEMEVACKNAVIDLIKEKYNEQFSIEDIQVVWMSKTLKNFKCILIDMGYNQRLYECTYNGEKKELYVDVYKKQYNKKIDFDDMKFQIIE